MRGQMNKSLITNLVALALVLVGFLFEQAIVLSVGLFALSGAVTNWLAIHMLFEKVPFLYGSGVITLKFASFKVAIRNLILTEFFSEQKINNLLSKAQPNIDFEGIITKVDLNVNADSDLVEELDIATTDVNGLHDYPRDTTLTVYKAQGASSNETLYKQGDYAFTTPFTPVGCVVTEKQIEALRYDVYFNLELEPYKTAFQKVGEIKIKDSKHAAKIRQIIELKKNLIVKELADLKVELQHKQGIFDHYVYLKAEGHLTK